MTATRRLAAILAADVAGYSRLVGTDEGGTLQALKAIRAELIDPTIAAHNGRLVKTTGDGLLVEFGSVVDALLCATKVQAGMAERNTTVPDERRVEFRIGINVGDVVVEDGDIFGDGVNVAARLEALAEPGGICVSARVQEDAAGKLDLAFEDMGQQELKNIARPVRLYRVRDPAAPAEEAVPAAAQPLPLPDKPSIAVLAFQNMSGDPEQEYFADGIAEDIITTLSRYPSLFVIARNSSFTFKGRAVDVKQVGRELGVRYVLEGSLRKSGNRIRVTAQLAEAETSNHIWAERYDRDPLDIFAVQDEITEAVTIAVAPAIRDAELRRALRKPIGTSMLGPPISGACGISPKSLRTTTFSRRASFSRPLISIPPSPEATRASRWLTIRLLPTSGARPPNEAHSSAEPLAHRAIALDPADAEAHAALARARLVSRGDYGGALAAAGQALALSPNLASAHRTSLKS